MRKLPIILSCAVGLAMSQISVADSNYPVRYNFSKPGRTNEQFRSDRDTCLVKSENTFWSQTGASTTGGDTERTAYIESKFLNCMEAEGYRQDPNGFKAGDFRRIGGNRLIRKT